MSNSQKIDLETYKLIIETVFDAKDLGQLGSSVTQLLVGAMEVKGATIFIVNPVKEELEILATKGLSINYINKGPILVDKSIKLAANLEPVIISDTKKSDLLQYPDKAEKEKIRSIISLPVNLHQKIIGALRIYHSEIWEISDRELAYLSVLAKNLGMALRYFRLSAVIQSTKESLDEIHPVWL